MLYGNLPWNNTDILKKTRTRSGENVDNVRRIHVELNRFAVVL